MKAPVEKPEILVVNDEKVIRQVFQLLKGYWRKILETISGDKSYHSPTAYNSGIPTVKDNVFSQAKQHESNAGLLWNKGAGSRLSERGLTKMSKMCPLTGCKEKQGICTHEKVMVMLLAAAALAGIAMATGLF